MDIEKMIQVVPSERQLKWQQMEFYGFIHYGLNTYIGVEWSDGKTPLDVLTPTDLDVEQWVVSMKAAEMKGIIMFCKHHDGFCLWNTKTTDYNIMNTCYGKDLIAEVSACCREYGMKFGVYLSPWDMSHPTYGTEAYNDIYVQQLDELLSNYGEVFSVWMDGACGEGPNGKKQPYDWERYYNFIREKQPEAVISIAGPDVRWCGNEAGKHRPQEWSVVPKRLQSAELIGALSQQSVEGAAMLRELNSTILDLGSRQALEGEEDLVWYPCEVDTSIRPGWFYMEHDDKRVRSIDELLNIYINTVGGNCCLLLNTPPGKEGYFKKEDVKRLNQIGCFIRDTFRDNLLENADISTDTAENGADIAHVVSRDETIWKAERETAVIEFVFDTSVQLNYLVLMEDIRQSQRIEEFEIEVQCKNGYDTIYKGTAVGYKKICHFEMVETKAIRIRIIKSRGCPTLQFVGGYKGRAILSRS